MDTTVPQALKAFFDRTVSGDGKDRYTLTLRGSEVGGKADAFGNELRELRAEALGRGFMEEFKVEGAGTRLILNFTSEAFQKMRNAFLKDSEHS